MLRRLLWISTAARDSALRMASSGPSQVPNGHGPPCLPHKPGKQLCPHYDHHPHDQAQAIDAHSLQAHWAPPGDDSDQRGRGNVGAKYSELGWPESAVRPPQPWPASTPDASSEMIPATPIRIFREVSALRAWRRSNTDGPSSVGLVPTMGALHEGHLDLIRMAARENDRVVVSLYINPAQFGAREDFSSYPTTWAADAAALAKLDCELAVDASKLGRISVVFVPDTATMYPSGFPGQEIDSKGSFVTITPVSEVLEGASRPTFFRGVATVCMKLFNIVQPDHAYFGQKDIQQTVVVRRMVHDLMLPLRIVVCPTRREPDGLAMSSRNVYLGPRRRRIATVLHEALTAAAKTHSSGELHRHSIIGAARRTCMEVLQAQQKLPPKERALFEIDYLSLADPDSLTEVDCVEPSKGAIISGAIRMLPLEHVSDGEDVGHAGGPLVRLIDNIILPGITSLDAEMTSTVTVRCI